MLAVARPYTIIFSTETVDGKIASYTGFSRLSCPEDFIIQHELRASVDAVMVGSNTALKDDPRLTVRLVGGHSPLRVVVDSKLRVPPSYRLFSGGRGILVTTEDHGEELSPYMKAGITIVKAGKNRVDLPKALHILYGMGIRRLMVEGGGGLNCALISRGLADELWVTIAPMAFGSGVSLLECADRAFDGEQRRVELSLVGYRIICGSWVHLKYRITNNHSLHRSHNRSH